MPDNKRKALEQISKKLSKVVPHFGNENGGEALNALRHATKYMKEVGLDWHDMFALWSEQQESILDKLLRLLEKDAEALVRLGVENVAYFHAGNEAYADVVQDGYRLTLPVASRDFADYLLHLFYIEKRKAPTESALKSAVRTLSARARYDGPQNNVYLRVAMYAGKVYLDLGDPQGRVVEVDMQDWRIVTDSPVRFRRTPDMAALPLPQRGGSIDQLRPYVNLSDANFVLYVGVLVDALYPASRPRPLAGFFGVDGVGKTTAARVIRDCVDPAAVKLRGLPRTVRDLFVNARAQHVLAYDNVGKISPAMSDALCQITSGTGFGARKFFTDADEVTIGGSHAVLLTAITNPVTAPDLSSRLVSFLPVAQPARFRTDEEFWIAFEAERPQIIGALLDRVVLGLRRLPDIRLTNPPRMADFATWATACEDNSGAFMRAFEESATEAAETVIEQEPVADAVSAFMSDRDDWQGTAAALLHELTEHDRTERRVSRQKDWPRDPALFGRRLRKSTTALRQAGVVVVVDRAKDSKRTRSIELRRVASTTPPDVTPPPPDKQPTATNPAAGQVLAIRRW